MGSSLYYKQLITVTLLVTVVSSFSVAANQPGIQFIRDDNKQFILNGGINGNWCFNTNSIAQSGSDCSHDHVIRGNIHAACKHSFHQDEYDPARCSKSSVSSRIDLSGNYSFWALDSWKAFNGIDDDGDNNIDFTGLDWDEAIYLINTTVMAVTDNAVYFHDSSYSGRVSHDTTVATALLDEFELNIYPNVTEMAGDAPDIDNNGKLFVIVTDIRDPLYHGQPGELTGGCFWPLHSSENSGESVYSYSNESEIVFIDTVAFSGQELDIAGGLLAHEFTHLVHYSKDNDEDLWLDEGLAVYTQVACGYGESVNHYIEAFETSSGISLTYFDSRPESYGIAYLFIEYLVSKYENNILRGLFTSKTNGMESIAELADIQAGESNPIVQYFGFSEFLAIERKINPVECQSFPVGIEGSLESWSSVYLSLPPPFETSTEIVLSFIGETTTSSPVFSTFNYISVIMFNDSVHLDTVNLGVDELTATGQTRIKDYGTSYNECIIVIHLFAGTGSGNRKAIIVPCERYSVLLEVVDSTHSLIKNTQQKDSTTPLLCLGITALSIVSVSIVALRYRYRQRSINA